MKNSLLTACIILCTCLLFTQCKKNDAIRRAPDPDFSPLTTGTNWTYKFTEGTSTPTTYKLLVTSRDTVANGKTFKVLSNADGPNRYLAKVSNDYFRFASFPSIGINNFEELYLKDNKAVNDTWTSSTTIMYFGFPIKVNLNYTIKGKGESRTVNGKLYSKVIHVRLDLESQGSKAGGGDFYYQDGVGLIETIILVTAPDNRTYSSREELLSYEIK